MKGMFIPEITVEMFRNACPESIEDLMAEGEVYDIEYDPKSAEPKPQWIPCSERLPEEGTEVLGTDDHGCIRHVVKDKCRLYEFATYEEMMHINIVAWQPLPEPYEG